MGEHICASITTEPTVPESRISSMGNPFKLREYSASGREAASLAQAEGAGMGWSQRAPVKQSRVALPKINPDAANGAFLAPKDTGLELPPTPAESAHSGSGRFPPPSMTKPVSRRYKQWPASPELTANLDCAFPPFPSQATSSGRSTPSNGRETPTGSDRASSRAASRAQNLEAVPSSLEPKNSGLVSQKFETLRTGPFTARRQGSGDSSQEASVCDHKPFSRAASEERCSPTNTWVTKTPSGDDSARRKTEAAKGTFPPRPARLSYEQLSPVLLQRFSVEPDIMFPPRSELEHRADLINEYPVSYEHSHKYTLAQDLANFHNGPVLRHPPRKASLANVDVSHTPATSGTITVVPRRSLSRHSTRIDYRMEDAQPVPRTIQKHRKYSNHTPSESGSSTVSSANTYSSGPSPTSSAASSVDPFSPIGSTLSAQDEHARPAGANIRNQQEPGIRAELPSDRSPPRKFGRPAPSVDRLHVTPTEPSRTPKLKLAVGEDTLQPVTPATARTEPFAGQTLYSGGPLGLALSPTISSPSMHDAVPRDGPRLSPSAVSASRCPSRPRTAKPLCRGCGLTIEGKSVKAADGRLSGRWHKSCFVCTTCVKPFATADFYVIGDQPYCEHHYHERNGSLCHGCHRGIEGQYLETTSTTRFGVCEKKFHPRCFTCATCHEVLSEDYFEISGVGALCERHALATLRQQQIRSGSRPYGMDRRDMYAERRTTRLINPMVA